MMTRAELRTLIREYAPDVLEQLDNYGGMPMRRRGPRSRQASPGVTVQANGDTAPGKVAQPVNLNCRLELEEDTPIVIFSKTTRPTLRASVQLLIDYGTMNTTYTIQQMVPVPVRIVARNVLVRAQLIDPATGLYPGVSSAAVSVDFAIGQEATSAPIPSLNWPPLVTGASTASSFGFFPPGASAQPCVRLDSITMANVGATDRYLFLCDAKNLTDANGSTPIIVPIPVPAGTSLGFAAADIVGSPLGFTNGCVWFASSTADGVGTYDAAAQLIVGGSGQWVQ